jgi:hypothetical protein
MSKISLPRRYWNSLTCTAPSRSMPAAGRSRAGHRFWPRYWASFIAADLPPRRPAAGIAAVASAAGSQRPAGMPSAAEQPLPDVLVLDRVNGAARGPVPKPRRARASWSAPASAAAAVLAIVVGLAVVVPAGLRALPGLAGPAWSPPPAGSSANAVRLAYGAFPGLALESVQIPVRSLAPSLAAQFHQGRTAHATTVTGFEFRNRGAAGLCLTAVNTGAAAGKNGDPVRVDTCARTPNQIWIPLQWQTSGSTFTHLVNDQYQSMCLNADDRGGGMRAGRIVQLWDCYPAADESWDFGDWYYYVKTGNRSFPIFSRSGELCLDADKFDLRDGTSVRLWTQYAAANQFWT